METIIKRLSYKEIIVLFCFEDGTVRAVSCEVNAYDEDLTQFDSLMRSLYEILINPIKKDISKNRRRISQVERFIAKKYPLHDNLNIKYIKMIAESKLEIDKLKQLEKVEMKKISSIYNVVSPIKIKYLRNIRDRESVKKDLERLNRKIQNYEQFPQNFKVGKVEFSDLRFFER